jgi:hypothetical protein
VTSAPEVRLLPDRPTALERDEFDHVSYTSVLAETVLSASGPATIGLFGPWGVGKSSILRRLRESLKGQCGFVEFDAWRSEGESLRRQFVLAVDRDLRRDSLLDGSFKSAERLHEVEADRQSTRIRRRLSLGPSALAALVVFLIAWALMSTDAVSDALVGPDAKRETIVPVITALLVLVVTLITQAFPAASETATTPRIEDPERFHAIFRDLVAAVKTPRLVIAIDNLDRCSAEQALDLLRTVKTYLEPAIEEGQRGATRTEVVFVIAVDDQALRRHLTANEFAALAHGGEGQAARFVDEYLRKVFTTSLRIAPLLDDDLRAYIAGAVRQAAPSLAIGADAERELITVIHAALRSNPRRIIQFLNNLQLRLRLLRERERARGDRPPLIQPRVSDQPLMVAKLALIEEEWPEHYQRLLAQPQELAEWQRVARGLPSGGPDPSEISERWGSLATFLQLTEEIRTTNLRAFLRFKQSRDELSVPDYGAFREALTTGDRDGVGQVVDAHPDAAADYADAALDIFAQELAAGHNIAARAALDCLLDGRVVPASPGVRAQALRTAVDTPAFADDVASLPAAAVLDAARKLDPQRRDGVVDTVIARLSADDADVGVAAVVSAVVDHVDLLSDAQRTAVARAASRSPLVGRPVLLLTLQQADARLITLSVVEAVAERVRAVPKTLSGPHGEAVAILLLDRLEDEDIRAHLTAALPAALAVGADVDGRGIADRVRRLATVIAEEDPSAASGLLHNLSLNFGQLPEDDRFTFAGWLWSEVARHEADVEERRQQILAPLLGSPHRALAWIADRAADVAPATAQWVVDSLIGPAAGDADLRTRLVELIDLLDPPERDLRRMDLAVAAAQADGSVDDVGALLDGVGDWPGPERDVLLGALVARARAGDGALDERLGWLRLAARLPTAALTTHADPLGRALREAAEAAADPSEVSEAIATAAALRRDGPLDTVETVADVLLQKVGQLRAADPTLRALIAGLEAEAPALSARSRTLLGTLMWERWIDEPNLRRGWEERIAKLLRPARRELDPLVELVLAQDRAGTGDPHHRAEVLLALRRMAANHPALDQRLRELDASDDPDDQEVIAGYRAVAGG